MSIDMRIDVDNTRYYNSLYDSLWDDMVRRMVFKDHIIVPKVGENFIQKVIYNDPATIVLWGDGTKTVAKCDEHDTFNKEIGLLLCVMKKFFGNKQTFNLLETHCWKD